MISVSRSRQVGTTIKISNYAAYQGFSDPGVPIKVYNEGYNEVYNEVASKSHKQECIKNVKEKKKKTLPQNAAVDEFFERVWLLYPEKKGKAAVSKKAKKALLTLGYDTVKRCIDRYVDDKPDYARYQYGSTFFNTGYVDYLDENYGDAPTTPPAEALPSEERSNF